MFVNLPEEVDCLVLLRRSFYLRLTLFLFPGWLRLSRIVCMLPVTTNAWARTA